jgi:acyl dehydratase
MSVHTVDVERGRLRFFAQVTGQSDPVYTEVDAARAAGHRDLPVPPTFLFCLEMERPDPWDFVAELGVDLRTILHGGQSFEYHAMAFAGDRLTFASGITDRYQKKNGALTFVERTTDVSRDDEPVARLVTTIVLRSAEGPA